MSPSEKARHYGCETLAEVSKVSGVPRRTLEDWSRTKPFVFEAVCRLVAAYNQGE